MLRFCRVTTRLNYMKNTKKACSLIYNSLEIINEALIFIEDGLFKVNYECMSDFGMIFFTRSVENVLHNKDYLVEIPYNYGKLSAYI